MRNTVCQGCGYSIKVPVPGPRKKNALFYCKECKAIQLSQKPLDGGQG